LLFPLRLLKLVKLVCGQEGVVFVLSGFVNPERGILRSRAMEMGAEFKPDWNSNCTLLVCAFPNTPKFRQVEAECGTIVSKVFLCSFLFIFACEWSLNTFFEKYCLSFWDG
jgi:hypothetical protein